MPTATVDVPVSVRSRSIRGMRTTPGASTRILRRAPFAFSSSVAGSETWSRGGASETMRTAGAFVSTISGTSTAAAPSASVASTDTVYVPSSARPSRLRPSQDAVCSPGPAFPEKSVATRRPSRSTQIETSDALVRGTTTETMSVTPSAFGVRNGLDSVTVPIARLIRSGISATASRPPVAWAVTRTR